MKQTLQIGFVILLIVISCSYSFAQKNISVLDYIPEPNGPVTYITKDTATHTLYVAGDFTTVGGVTHTTGAFINNTDGQPIPGFPKIDGPVNTSIPDGNGGWYIGGDFTHVGDREQYDLTQIDSAGNVTDFFKGMKTDGYVNTICKNNSTLYVGGQFTTIGKNASKYCAVLDSYTGGSALNLEGFNGP
ncbi:MAG: hypothetical protein NT126_08360, partial [Bacteroidetes bacterium]|nr:hypothetical protein [Bacteroidota bacterium]